MAAFCYPLDRLFYRFHHKFPQCHFIGIPRFFSEMAL